MDLPSPPGRRHVSQMGPPGRHAEDNDTKTSTKMQRPSSAYFSTDESPSHSASRAEHSSAFFSADETSSDADADKSAVLLMTASRTKRKGKKSTRAEDKKEERKTIFKKKRSSSSKKKTKEVIPFTLSEDYMILDQSEPATLAHKLPSDVSSNKVIKKKRSKEKKHKKLRPKAPEVPPDFLIPEPLQDESCSSSISGAKTFKRNNKAKKNKKLRRAPAPPGSDNDTVMESPHKNKVLYPTTIHPPSLRVNPDTMAIATLPPPPRQSPDDVPFDEEPAKRKKSFTKAVVAAAVSDATVHGRVFSQKDVRQKEAMSELSSDPVLSQYFHSVGQSFKTSAPVPPTTTYTTPRSRSSTGEGDPLADSWRGSSFLGHLTANSSKTHSSRSLSPHPHLHGSVSGAVKEVLEDTHKHEMKYKIHLLENLFDDVAGAEASLTRRQSSLDPPASPAQDAGDAKVASTTRRQSRKSKKGTPPRDIDQDVCLVKKDPADLERGMSSSDEPSGLTLSMSSTQRKSSVSTSMAGIFRVDDDRTRKRVYCLAIVAVLLIFGFIILVVVSEIKGNNSTSSPAPTMAPTSFQYGVLPEYTQQTIQYSNSPQARAFFWLEQDVYRGSISVDRALQRFVLAALFYATRGDHWRQSVSWMIYGRSECAWYTHEFHAVCNPANQYNTLSLPDNSLDGTLPEELELLTSLNIVQLQNNELHGKFPRRIWSSWKHLAFLNLYNNSLSGTLPPDVGFLGKSELLNTLILRKNRFSGYIPSELGFLDLQFLSLSDNLFRGSLPSEFGLLTNAEAIYLYGNHLSGRIPSTLGQLTKLKHLELHSNDFTGPVPPELCDLMSNGNLTTLTVDCGFVQCTCGCDCTATMGLFIQRAPETGPEDGDA